MTLVSLHDVTKAFGQSVVLRKVSFDLLPAEVHALAGENGAGKSTLMNIIYGVVKADAGTIAWNGAPVTIPNPAAARRLGIGMVFQHFSLFETLTVTENIALAVEGTSDLGALSERIFRISAMGDIREDDLERLVAALEDVLAG